MLAPKGHRRIASPKTRQQNVLFPKALFKGKPGSQSLSHIVSDSLLTRHTFGVPAESLGRIPVTDFLDEGFEVLILLRPTAIRAAESIATAVTGREPTV